MDSNDWRAAQGQVQIPGQVMSGDAVANPEGGDWRTQLFSDSRRKIVNMIMEYLKRHLPFSGQEGLQELEKIAIRCEEKSHTAATSQQDYLRKISLEILEAKSQNPIANSLQPNAASNSRNPQDPASFGSSSQTGNANGGDWQVEVYQKIKSMNEMYFPELNEMYQRMAAKLQQHDALNPSGPQQPKNEQLEKLRFLKVMLERFILFLRTNKNEVQPDHKERIVGVEKQIINILNSNRLCKPAGPLTQPPMHAMQQPQQQQSQISQMHGNEGQMNSQMQQMVGIQHGTPSLETNQQPVHMLQQSLVGVQQQMQTNMGSMLPNQTQQPQSQPTQQLLMSQIQSQPGQMQQQLGLQLQSNTLPREIQQRIQTSAPLIQQQTMIDQQKQFLQSQRAMPEASLRNANGGDWQEELYQKIKSMNEMYFPELNEMYQRMAAKLQKYDALNPPGPQQPRNEQLEKLRFLKVMLERFILFLRTNKNEVQPHHKERIVGVEKQIINILNSNRLCKPAGPLTQPSNACYATASAATVSNFSNARE